ncbi:MAG: hypothetical protein JJU02_16620 [Cryomorphaceae bacterium]|nr:hypothetical protein [Cryomorphaceae bacterium]
MAKRLSLLTLPLTAAMLLFHYMVWPQTFSVWPMFFPLVYALLTISVMAMFLVVEKLHAKEPQLAVYAILGFNMLKMLSVLTLVLIAVFRLDFIPLAWSYPLVFLYFTYLIFAVVGSIMIVKN